jgi:predicted regulator of Ras-like GTPase activity (Roadblock/LC7/MglB family)
MTPELALDYLGELSTDIRGAAVLDATGAVAAQTGFEEDDADEVRKLVVDLFDRAAEVRGNGSGPNQVEVSLPDGAVYAVREKDWAVAVVAGRFALSSLMFYDLRMVIRDLDGAK